MYSTPSRAHVYAVSWPILLFAQVSKHKCGFQNTSAKHICTGFKTQTQDAKHICGFQNTSAKHSCTGFKTQTQDSKHKCGFQNTGLLAPTCRIQTKTGSIKVNLMLGKPKARKLIVRSCVTWSQNHPAFFFIRNIKLRTLVGHRCPVGTPVFRNNL